LGWPQIYVLYLLYMYHIFLKGNSDNIDNDNDMIMLTNIAYRRCLQQCCWPGLWLPLLTVYHSIYRWSPYWNLPSTFSPGTTDYRQRRCRQQLRARALHRRQRDNRFGSGQNPKARRSMYRSSGLPDFPFIRWWYRIWLLLPVDGEIVRWFRQKIQIGVRHLSSSTDLHCCCWAVQLNLDDPYNFGALRLRIHGR